MTAKDRYETKRTPCDCGNGEFVFYSVQYDGWSFLHNPDVEWYEMHIYCDNCIQKYSVLESSIYKTYPTKPLILKIPQSETPPEIK